MLARMGRGGVGTLRINLSWGSVQSSPDADYDWTHYDLVIGGAALNGIRVLATVYGSPPWAESTPEHPPLGSAQTRFDSFVRAAVQRYGADGSFWKEHPDLPVTAHRRLAALERAELASLLEAGPERRRVR